MDNFLPLIKNLMSFFMTIVIISNFLFFTLIFLKSDINDEFMLAYKNMRINPQLYLFFTIVYFSPFSINSFSLSLILFYYEIPLTLSPYARVHVENCMKLDRVVFYAYIQMEFVEFINFQYNTSDRLWAHWFIRKIF